MAMEMIPEMVLAFYDKENCSGVTLDQVRDKVDYDCKFESLKEGFVPHARRYNFQWEQEIIHLRMVQAATESHGNDESCQGT